MITLGIKAPMSVADPVHPAAAVPKRTDRTAAGTGAAASRPDHTLALPQPPVTRTGAKADLLSIRTTAETAKAAAAEAARAAYIKASLAAGINPLPLP